MKIRFWGVRGSIPVSLSRQQVQAKLSAAIQRISVKDLESADTRERFIASLPEWMFGTVGGNTSCVQIVTDNGGEILLDGGTGLRVLGKDSPLPADKHYDLVLSHFHWDHIQGIPFFCPLYNHDVSVDIYSAYPAMERILRAQMDRPYFPVAWDVFKSSVAFHTVAQGQEFLLKNGEVKVYSCKMNHPGNSYSYSFVCGGKKLVYATDIELNAHELENRDARRAHVFKDADVLIFDSMYTAEEAKLKTNFGHSAFMSAIDFATAWNVKNLYLYHYEPAYDDKKLDAILLAARRYADYISGGKVSVHLAVEGAEIEL